MISKRLGMQLGGSGLVVLLGALGISQVPKGSPSEDVSQLLEVEPPPTLGPPAPIAAAPTFVPLEELAARNANSPDAFAPPGEMTMEGGDPTVRQVGHEETFALPPQPIMANGAGNENPSAASEAPGFALPAMGNQDGPALAFAPPVDAPADANLDAQAPPSGLRAEAMPAEMPSPSFAPFPANQLRSAPAAEAVAGLAAAGLAAAGLADLAPPAALAPADLPTGDASVDANPQDDAAQAPGGFGLPLASPSDSPAAVGAAPMLQPIGGDEGPTGLAFVPSQGDAAPAPEMSPPQTLNLPADATPMPPQGTDFASGPSPLGLPSPDAIPFASGRSADGMALPDGSAPSAAPASAAPQGFASLPKTNLVTPSAADPSAVVAAPASMGAARGFAAPAALASASLPQADDPRLLNEPGDRRLEGVQAPSVVIHKRAPDQVKVGKPATFVIQIQNTGVVEAADVEVHDRIPAGMKLVEATPQATVSGDRLLWQLGTLEPGGERTISMQLIPEVEGELGSVARVSFEAAAAVRTVSTRPAIKISQRAPDKVLIGQQVEIELEVANPGSGAATGVVLQTDVPEGLEHPKGRQLDNLIGVLAPGEVRRQVLRLRAVAPGVVNNEIRLTGDDGLSAVDTVPIEIIAPALAVELEGPARRFLERQATYQIRLANVGSAEATNVEVVAYLDRGFSFVGTEHQGQYDPSRHAVFWSLAELPPEAQGTVPLTLLPIEAGERAIKLEARGDLNLVSRSEKRVTVDAPADLTFAITDDADPIEIGSMATYEIKIMNRGAGDDADVNLKLQLPDGLELVSSESDASTDGKGLVVFAPQAVIPARGEIVHRIRVKGAKPGTQIVRAVVTSRAVPTAVTKEESTTVYSDN